MASTSGTNQNPQPIIDLILADINAVIPNLSSLVASYRLLVGASEEFQRTPEICPDVFERAVRRADNSGTLIDIFLELLYCKIAFSSEFLKLSCAPVDLFRLLANRSTATDIPFHTAEQVVEMEVLRRVLEKCQIQNPCLPDYPVVCPEPPPIPPICPQVPPICSPIVPPTCPQNTPPTCCPTCNQYITDIQEVGGAVLLTKLQSKLGSKRELPPVNNEESPEQSCPLPHISEMSTAIRTKQQLQQASARELPIESRVRRKHLKDAYDTHTKP